MFYQPYAIAPRDRSLRSDSDPNNPHYRTQSAAPGTLSASERSVPRICDAIAGADECLASACRRSISLSFSPPLERVYGVGDLMELQIGGGVPLTHDLCRAMTTGVCEIAAEDLVGFVLVAPHVDGFQAVLLAPMALRRAL